MGSRSLMNVCFTTGDDALDMAFWKGADQAQIVGLKGHKSRGGLRATMYNAQSDDAVAALVDWMRDFEAKRG